MATESTPTLRVTGSRASSSTARATTSSNCSDKHPCKTTGSTQRLRPPRLTKGSPSSFVFGSRVTGCSLLDRRFFCFFVSTFQKPGSFRSIFQPFFVCLFSIFSPEGPQHGKPTLSRPRFSFFVSIFLSLCFPATQGPKMQKLLSRARAFPPSSQEREERGGEREYSGARAGAESASPASEVSRVEWSLRAFIGTPQRQSQS